MTDGAASNHDPYRPIYEVAGLGARTFTVHTHAGDPDVPALLLGGRMIAGYDLDEMHRLIHVDSGGDRGGVVETEDTWTGEASLEESTGADAGGGAAVVRGALIDRFVVLGVIGLGGMGVVYAAYDPELDRKVALKLVSPARADVEAGRARLLREAQALAKLAHPNVVAVHDVGTRDDRVWIAMEFVSGQTLAVWAKERTPRWPELLRVLTDAARGVAAAHAAGLVHRDLKPDNVMMGRDGRVRVMDFGLAHGRVPVGHEDGPDDSLAGAAEPEFAALAARLTRVGAVQGTPNYMAPEQWRGQEAEAAADQFGWCVMAWELLYGERPFAGATAVVLAAAVSTGQRRRPPRGRRVPGWLRRVLERGLMPEASQRWPTMMTLLAALERGQARARVLQVAGLLVGVAGVVLAVTGGRAWREARAVAACEATGAEIEAGWNEDVKRRVRAAFAATGASYAGTSAEKVMPWLDEQARVWKAARTEACLNEEVRGAWDAGMLARATWCLADRRRELESLVDEFAAADTKTIVSAVSGAASLRSAADCTDEGVLVRQPAPPTEGLAEIRGLQVAISRAGALRTAGKYSDGLRVITEARANGEAVIAWPPVLADARELEGALLVDTGDFAAGEVASKDAFFAAGRADAPEIAAGAALDLVFLLGYKQARHAEGREWARHAEVAIAHAGDRAGLLAGRLAMDLGHIEQTTGAYAAARERYAQALTLYEQALGPEHPDVGPTLNALAVAHRSLREFAEAKPLFERALALQERAFGPEHPHVAKSLGNLAMVYDDTGESLKALEMYERSLAMKKKVYGAEHPDVATGMVNLATAHYALGENDRAAALWEEAVVIYEKAHGPEHPLVALTLNNIAVVRRAAGAYPEARALFERVVAIEEKKFGADHPQVAESLGELAKVYLDEHRPREALPLLERARSVFEAHEGWQPGEGEVHFAIARTLVAAGGDRGRALSEARRAREIFEETEAAEELAAVERWLAERAGGR